VEPRVLLEKISQQLAQVWSVLTMEDETALCVPCRRTAINFELLPVERSRFWSRLLRKLSSCRRYWKAHGAKMVGKAWSSIYEI